MRDSLRITALEQEVERLRQELQKLGRMFVVSLREPSHPSTAAQIAVEELQMRVAKRNLHLHDVRGLEQVMSGRKPIDD